MMIRFALTVILLWSLLGQSNQPRPVSVPPTAGAPASRLTLDRKIAARFAPIFKQGLGDQPRADYITNFDFDGDWKGDNNWKNLDNRTFRLRAWVYFSVIETTTHYFVHYAIFHPRDYKGDLVTSTLLETLIRAGVGKLGTDPSGGLAEEVALSHENDLEGCLVVATRNGNDLERARVEYVETMAHNRYLRYRPAGAEVAAERVIQMRGQQPVLFVEPKGHGVSRFRSQPEDHRESVNGVLSYVYKGRPEDPETIKQRREGVDVGYALTPIAETLWRRALTGANETYGEAAEYALLQPKVDPRAGSIETISEAPRLALGSAFRGDVGSPNRARPPWGWYDRSEKDRPAGEWFLDPAEVVARHFNLGKDFSRIYTYHPFRLSLK